MKDRLIAFPFCLFIMLAPARADMVIVQKLERAGQTIDMTMKIKGDKIRTDISPEVSTITDQSTGDVIEILHNKKSYLKLAAAQTEALMNIVKQMKNGGKSNG